MAASGRRCSIHTAPDVRFVCLSATVSNADELGAWLTSVRGPTDVVVEHRRPVELRNRFLAAARGGGLEEVPVLVDGEPNPLGDRFGVDRPQGRRRQGTSRPRQRWRVPRRAEVAALLAETDRLPAIVFVFSRAGCDEAAAGLAEQGVRLTTAAESAAIRAVVEAACVGIGDRGPRGAAARPLHGATRGGDRRPPRRNGPGAEGGRRRVLLPRPREARVRDRDVGPGPQHAGEERGDRAPRRGSGAKATRC